MYFIRRKCKHFVDNIEQYVNEYGITDKSLFMCEKCHKIVTYKQLKDK